MLHFLVHKIFTLYINGVLNCKCQAAGQKNKKILTNCAPPSLQNLHEILTQVTVKTVSDYNESIVTTL
jgi:hypothetical protein